MWSHQTTASLLCGFQSALDAKLLTYYGVEYLTNSQVVLHQARHMAHPLANVRMDITWRSCLVKPSSLISAAEAGLKAPLQFNTAPLTLQVFFPLTSFTHSVIWP